MFRLSITPNCASPQLPRNNHFVNPKFNLSWHVVVVYEGVPGSEPANTAHSKWFSGTSYCSGLSMVGLLPCVPGSLLSHHFPSARTIQLKVELLSFVCHTEGEVNLSAPSKNQSGALETGQELAKQMQKISLKSISGSFSKTPMLCSLAFSNFK